MSITIIGEHPFTKDNEGHFTVRIGTAFPKTKTLITLPGIHATQRLDYINILNQALQKQSKPVLTEAEEASEIELSVDLVIENGIILIRPDPENMTLAFETDEMLQELTSKQRIRFLYVMNTAVRQAMKERGECWRISPLPFSPGEMGHLIRHARMRINNLPIYYYNNVTGTHYITCHEFAGLESLEHRMLASQLQEIKELSGKRNRSGNPEIAFFVADDSFGPEVFASHDFYSYSSQQLAAAYDEMRTRFKDATKPAFQADRLDNQEWRNQMFSTLIGQPGWVISDEILRGLSPEFFMQIKWLPGGRLDSGELIFDSVFDEKPELSSGGTPLVSHDDRVKGFILNFVRDYGEVEYVNVGNIISTLARRTSTAGARSVYIAEIKMRNTELPIVLVLRMQKWGVREHIDLDNDSLEQAMQKSEEYTEYILDRHSGCRQLGMNLPGRITAQKISETYHGAHQEHENRTIWITYFVRDYIRGIATDKIPAARYLDPEFSVRLAKLLGKAAAPNIIVGRVDADNKVLFDDGDEVLIDNSDGQPEEMVVADHTGAFADYNSDLTVFAREYAHPVNGRIKCLSDPKGFADAYLRAFEEEFLRIQLKYRNRRRAFDNLFVHHRHDEAGNLPHRWEQVLERLDRTDAVALGKSIRQCLNLEDI